MLYVTFAAILYVFLLLVVFPFNLTLSVEFIGCYTITIMLFVCVYWLVPKSAITTEQRFSYFFFYKIIVFYVRNNIFYVCVCLCADKRVLTVYSRISHCSDTTVTYSTQAKFAIEISVANGLWPKLSPEFIFAHKFRVITHLQFVFFFFVNFYTCMHSMGFNQFLPFFQLYTIFYYIINQ